MSVDDVTQVTVRKMSDLINVTRQRDHIPTQTPDNIRQSFDLLPTTAVQCAHRILAS